MQVSNKCNLTARPCQQGLYGHGWHGLVRARRCRAQALKQEHWLAFGFGKPG